MNIIVTLIDKQGNIVEHVQISKDSIMYYGEDTLFLDSGEECTWIVVDDIEPSMEGPVYIAKTLHIAEPLSEIRQRIESCR